MRTRGALGIVVVAIVCATLPAGVSAAPGATLIGVTGTHSLKLTSPRRESTATLVLLVRNDSFHAAKPSAGFISTAIGWISDPFCVLFWLGRALRFAKCA